jgi:hypothetical protein
MAAGCHLARRCGVLAVSIIALHALCFAGLAIRDGARWARAPHDGGPYGDRVTFGCMAMVMLLMIGFDSLLLLDAATSTEADRIYTPGRVVIMAVGTLLLTAILRRAAR